MMGTDAHNTRKAVKELGNMLLSKPLYIPTTGGFAVCNWFAWYEYKEGRIHCSFHPKLKPYMLQLKEQFTKYRLENILRFKSAYSIRVYELAKSWEGKGGFEISVQGFREIMGLECPDKKDKDCKPKYRLYGDLKRKVLERAIKEINSLSDITITYKEKKLGRKVTDLVFTIKKNLPKEQNYLVSRRAFIAYMRKNFINQTLYAGPAKREDGGIAKVEFAISEKGRLYDKLSAEDFTADKAEKIWSWLYEIAKLGKLSVLKQTTIDDFN
jgi:plasmid replication initiation protein